jgi:UDP-N-acetyl-D-glucosamine dehydrogenase
MKNLISKIENKKAKIGVVGLGYVGLPLLLSFAKKGFPVYGLDTNKKKIDLLKKGKTNLKKYEKLLKKVKKKCRLNFEPNYKKFISSLDIIIICLPTPLKKNNSPDISFIKRCVYKLDKFLRKDQAIILESTSYPGTTREIILPIIKKKKFRIGKDFFLIYSPEREDPTYKNFTINNIPKVISGLTRNCLIVADKIYNKITTTVKVSSLESAEFTKLLENIYRSVNIGFINEMKIIAHKMKIDIHESIKAAETKPFGFRAFNPGPGLGGHCIPIDPHYLAWKSKQFGVRANFIKLSAQVNGSMPKYVVSNLLKNLKNKNKLKSPKKNKILIVGVTYKENIDDIRESPALEIIKILLKNKFLVSYADPHYNGKIEVNKKTIKKIKINYKSLNKYSAIIIVADHDKFDYKKIKKTANLIIDTRNRYPKNTTNVVKS